MFRLISSIQLYIVRDDGNDNDNDNGLLDNTSTQCGSSFTCNNELLDKHIYNSMNFYKDK